MTKQEAETSGKRPATKEKIRSIMEAASALTALGDESEEGSRPSSPNPPKPEPSEEPKKEEPVKETPKSEEKTPKRYLPSHKKADAAMTFPEKLMKLMRYAEKQGDDFCVAWSDDGKSFIVKVPDAFVREVIPKFFKPTKFSSFTRKLYRWGFRQVNRGIGPDDPIIFGNEYFQRDSPDLMAKMRSVTAASNRKMDQQFQHYNPVPGYNMKRPFDGPMDDGNHKRMFFDQMLQQKSSSFMPHYGGMEPNSSMSLSNVLRPPMGMNGSMNGNMSGGMSGGTSQQYMPMNKGPYDFMGQQSGQHGNSMMGQYMPQNVGTSQQYPNASSTAEIVNAAIAALRYAN